MVPQELLPLLLSRLFPVIGGPDDLPKVVDLLREHGGEFCASLRIDPAMVAATCSAGFMPMSEDFTGHEVLLIKAHDERSVLRFDDLHVSRSTRRRARGLTITLDRDFDRCLDAAVAYHPERWLTERLCASLRSLHRESIDGVAAHSVELYDGDELVAGEIGYTCGAAYTSMSGFHLRSGSGSVQLAALGVLLQRAGFAFWDLGMPMEYKQALGARVVPRETFFDLYLDARRGETPAVAPRSACASLLADGSTASR